MRRAVSVARDGVEDVVAVHHAVAVGFGQVAEAVVEHDGEHDVVQGGVVGGGVAGAEAGGVLAHAGVAAEAVAVLDLPVAAVPGQEALGVGAFGGHGGDAAGGLGRGRAGPGVGALAHDAERLARAGEGPERVRQQVARGDASSTLWSTTAYEIELGSCCVELSYCRTWADSVNGREIRHLAEHLDGVCSEAGLSASRKRDEPSFFAPSSSRTLAMEKVRLTHYPTGDCVDLPAGTTLY